MHAFLCLVPCPLSNTTFACKSPPWRHVSACDTLPVSNVRTVVLDMMCCLSCVVNFLAARSCHECISPVRIRLTQAMIQHRPCDCPLTLWHCTSAGMHCTKLQPVSPQVAGSLTSSCRQSRLKLPVISPQATPSLTSSCRQSSKSNFVCTMFLTRVSM